MNFFSLTTLIRIKTKKIMILQKLCNYRNNDVDEMMEFLEMLVRLLPSKTNAS